MLAFASMLPGSDPVPLTLACHPQAPSGLVQRVDAVVASAGEGRLTLTYVLQGELSRLRIPECQPSGRADGLWRHTCFEAFLMVAEGPGYREFNFSPCGAWAVYAFGGYRDGGSVDRGPAPDITVYRAPDRLELVATICHDFPPPEGSLRLGLSAVVEDAGGGLSYWALYHPPGRPDFHHPEAFAIQMLRTEGEGMRINTGDVSP
ncbi:MAG TPA: DOMON-like domain-containing protein, partial [Gammaproteobacteria bacterium]|nr:DOMON-like domain-containing protein [Gammaproteobacteria bacterium]